MPYPVFAGECLDDLLREVYEDLLASGSHIRPGRGPALERVGVLLELVNPRARLSRSESRGRPFSALGEFLWYLAGRNDAEFITYYIADYPGGDASGHMPGGYGPRLFGGGTDSQMSRVRSLLASKRDSRQAVVQLFDRRDLETGQDDVPCTCTLQFLARAGTLTLVVHMRSNDAFLGLVHDVFCFTMLQEMMASDLGLQLGTYKHFVGSLHLYERDQKRAAAFVNEGWQSIRPMPAMPAHSSQAITRVLSAEADIRSGGPFDEQRFGELDAYWADIVRLLLVFRHSKHGERDAAERVAKSFTSETYKPFVEAKLSRIK